MWPSNCKQARQSSGREKRVAAQQARISNGHHKSVPGYNRAHVVIPSVFAIEGLGGPG